MKRNFFRNSIITFLALFCLSPLLIMIFNSFKAIDSTFTIKQYLYALFQSKIFIKSFWNSFVYTAIIILFNIPISMLAAYGFTRFEFRGKTTVFWAYIVIMLIPFQASIVPQYIVLKALNLLDTPFAVILPNIFSTFGAFLITQYMKGFDKQILDAGKIDGLGEFKLLTKLVVPICKPIFFALTILSFINYWSMIEQPLIFIQKRDYLPLSVLLNESSLFYGISLACGIIFTILPMLLYLYCYDDLVNGIALSSGNNNNAVGINANKIKRQQKLKHIIKNTIIGFLIFMIACTILTNKVAYVMTPKVSTIIPRSGVLRKNPNDQTSEEIGLFEVIIPKSCITGSGKSCVIYKITEDIQNSNKIIVEKMSVEIVASNGYECAVIIYKECEMVNFRSNQLYDGCEVVVVKSGDYND